VHRLSRTTTRITSIEGSAASGTGGRGCAGRPLRQGALLVGTLLLATACGSANGPDSTATGTPGQLPTSSPTPIPYGEILNAEIAPVSTALSLLGQAGSLDALNTALGNAQQAASSSAQALQETTAPVAVAATHRRLYVALSSLATDLGNVQIDIGESKVCATSSALAEAGQSPALKEVSTALQTLSADGYASGFSAPRLPQPQQRALHNGAWVRHGRDQGSGELTVDNNAGDTDAVLTLSKNGRSVYSFYVVKGKTAKVTGIEDGTYGIYFTTGLDWDQASRKFTESCDFTKFEASAHFSTTDNGYEIRYTTDTITLQPTVGGNAPTDPVPSGNYPVP